MYKYEYMVTLHPRQKTIFGGAGAGVALKGCPPTRRPATCFRLLKRPQMAKKSNGNKAESIKSLESRGPLGLIVGELEQLSDPRQRKRQQG